jgi:antitoxin component of MazEF toxin-antitoxin module
MGLKRGEVLQVEVRDDAITFRRTRRRKNWTLKALLKGVTPQKVGGEFDWGDPVGKEFA